MQNNIIQENKIFCSEKYVGVHRDCCRLSDLSCGINIAPHETRTLSHFMIFKVEVLYKNA
jgi:hypothetical protein